MIDIEFCHARPSDLDDARVCYSLILTDSHVEHQRDRRRAGKGEGARCASGDFYPTQRMGKAAEAQIEHDLPLSDVPPHRCRPDCLRRALAQARKLQPGLLQVKQVRGRPQEDHKRVRKRGEGVFVAHTEQSMSCCSSFSHPSPDGVSRRHRRTRIIQAFSCGWWDPVGLQFSLLCQSSRSIADHAAYTQIGNEANAEGYNDFAPLVRMAPDNYSINASTARSPPSLIGS